VWTGQLGLLERDECHRDVSGVTTVIFVVMFQQ